MHSPIRFVPAIFRKRPVHLTFFVTDKCNQKCPFCFYMASKTPENAQKAPILSIGEIQKISSSMGSLLWLAFSGGEIFLRDDLPEIARIFYKNNSPSIMLFPTNGMLPEVIESQVSDILKSCPKSVIAVKLSIDAIGAKHDAIRGINGSFERVLRTYEALSRFRNVPNFELGVNTVFSSLNEDTVDETIDFVQGLKYVKTHTISLIRGNLKDQSLKNADIEKYRKAAQKLEKSLKNKTSPVYGFRGARLKAAQDIIQRRAIYKTFSEGRGLLPCYAGRLNLVLTERGDLFPCESFEGRMLMGNVRNFDMDIKAVLRSKTAQNALKTVQNCHCTHECYMMTNILFNPRFYPALLKEWVDVLGGLR